AAARAHRRGQTRPVTVRRMITTGTVEEVMDERLQRKREVAGTAIIGVQGESDDYRDILAALARSPLPSS
ncbi:MAG: ATP-dependent helicase, partial [Dehalococcoidia bacterium]|nr:ATP-dependent helicase [Dehalococcoidia bacterium]